MKRFVLFLAACALWLGTAWAQKPPLPPIAGQVTFLYFNDLPKAAAFYRDVVGLEETFTRDFVRIFKITPTSFVGLVDATHGSHKPAKDKPVMVSIVAASPADVDRWHAALKARGATIRHPPEDVAKAGIRAMGFADPEGHTLEVFAWSKP